jgi:3-(3-hydroxy-phenyl)propionate hydroxylase
LVQDGDGAKVRLDDVLKGRWAVLYTDSPPARTEVWTDLGAALVHVDEPTLVAWMRRKKADAVVVRPDGFIYAASRSGQPLPAPAAITAIRTGVTA